MFSIEMRDSQRIRFGQLNNLAFGESGELQIVVVRGLDLQFQSVFRRVSRRNTIEKPSR